MVQDSLTNQEAHTLKSAECGKIHHLPTHFPPTLSQPSLYTQLEAKQLTTKQRPLSALPQVMCASVRQDRISYFLQLLITANASRRLTTKQ